MKGGRGESAHPRADKPACGPGTVPAPSGRSGRPVLLALFDLEALAQSEAGKPGVWITQGQTSMSRKFSLMKASSQAQRTTSADLHRDPCTKTNASKVKASVKCGQY